MADAVSRSDRLDRFYGFMSNRNPGIARLTDSFQLGEESDAEGVAGYAAEVGADLALIGPEAPLAEGLGDVLREEGVAVFGPGAEDARIESDKAWAREFMKVNGISNSSGTAYPEFGVFEDAEGAANFMDEFGAPVAVKPAGLTGGKGVKTVGDQLDDLEAAKGYAAEVLEKEVGGKPQVVIEELLVGEEFTIQAFCDGSSVEPGPAVQDHKRAYEGDEGPNTGGMGSYSDADGLLPFLGREVYDEAVDVMEQTVDVLGDYVGVLYGQFMATSRGPVVVEYNCRFGDPEAMNVLPLLETDFLDVVESCVEGSAAETSYSAAASVVKYVVPPGYPTDPRAVELRVDEEAIREEGGRVFYASVNEEDGVLRTTTSRALAVFGSGPTVGEAEEISERCLRHVDGEFHCRHDVGKPSVIERKAGTVESA